MSAELTLVSMWPGDPKRGIKTALAAIIWPAARRCNPGLPGFPPTAGAGLSGGDWVRDDLGAPAGGGYAQRPSSAPAKRIPQVRVHPKTARPPGGVGQLGAAWVISARWSRGSGM